MTMTLVYLMNWCVSSFPGIARQCLCWFAVIHSNSDVFAALAAKRNRYQRQKSLMALEMESQHAKGFIPTYNVSWWRCLYRKKKCRCLFIGYGWIYRFRARRLEGRNAIWMDSASERCRQRSSTQQFELEIWECWKN